MLKKYKTLSMFNKSMIFTIIYSLIALIIGLVLLCFDTSWLYGILMGIGLISLTTIINYFIYKIPSKGVMNVVGWPTISLVLRIIIFIIMFCLTIFVFNPMIIDGYETFDQYYLFHPINVIIMLFVYMIPGFAYFTVSGFSLFGSKVYD